jgi:SAM-dependent methyltransferase
MQIENNNSNQVSFEKQQPGYFRKAAIRVFRAPLKKILSRLGMLQIYARLLKLEVPRILYTAEYFLSNSGCEGAKEFKESRGVRLSNRLSAILAQIKNVEGNAFLDLGCGRGEILLQLESKASRLIGIDYSASAVEICRGITKTAQVIHADIVEFLPEFESEPFEGILMIDIAEHMFDWQLEIVFEHVARLLKRGGYLYIDSPLIPARPYSDMHVNIKSNAEEYLKFLPEFEIENLVLVDPVGSNHLITLRKSKPKGVAA